MSQSFVNQAPIYSGYTAPTRQIFLSGSGTYTTPAGVLFIIVEAVGAGGGGGGSGTVGGSAPGAGGNTTFSTVTATGGTAANWYVAGVGGTPSGGDLNIMGGSASTSSQLHATISGSEQLNGGSGGNGFFGGGGSGGQIGGGAGQAGSVNSGAGGGGGSTLNTASAVAGAGGGAGGYAKKQINSPAATYSYSVGTGGSAGGAGTSGYAGGAGAAGIIVVTEYYQLNTYGELLTFTGSGSAVKQNSPTITTPNITGVTSGATPAAGQVGEIIKSTILYASAVSLTTITPKHVTFIDVTAGKWLVFSQCATYEAGGTITVSYAWANLITPAALPDSSLLGGFGATARSITGMPIYPFIVNVSSTTRVYLSAYAQYTSGTANASGEIYAIRLAS